MTRTAVDASDALFVVLVEGAIDRDAEVRFEVDGVSMLPLVRPHDIVRIGPSAEARLRLGDVVALRNAPGGGLLLHRVVGYHHKRLLISGDNVSRADGLYERADVIGLLTRVERNGAPVWFGSGRLGWLVAFAVRAGLIWRFNWVYYALRRRAARCLKSHPADSRLREP